MKSIGMDRGLLLSVENKLVEKEGGNANNLSLFGRDISEYVEDDRIDLSLWNNTRRLSAIDEIKITGNIVNTG